MKKTNKDWDKMDDMEKVVYLLTAVGGKCVSMCKLTNATTIEVNTRGEGGSISFKFKLKEARG